MLRLSAALRLSPARVTLALTLAVLVLPYLGSVFLGGRDAKFGLVAPDAFYYLVVARNAVEHRLVSFDQSLTTNAFHPLWQLVSIVLYALCHLFSAHGDVVIVVSLVTGLLFVGAGLVFLGRAMTVSGARLSPLVVALPLGLYPLALYAGLGSSMRWNTLWGYANGMESGLLLGLYGALALAYVRLDPSSSRKQAVLFGLLCASFALARLDHALLPMLIVLAGFTRAAVRGPRQHVRFWLVCGATALAVLTAYMLVNMVYSGTALPVSGRLKSSFPEPVRDNFVHTVNFFRDSQKIGTTLRVRLAQLVIPLVATAAWGLASRQSRPRPAEPAPVRRSRTKHRRPARVSSPGTPRNRYREFLVLTGWMVVGIFSYNYFYVKPFDQGFWYTPVSVLFVSLLGLHAIARTRWHQSLVQSSRATIACAVLLAVATLAFYTAAFRDPGGHEYAHFYYVNAPQARAHYAATSPPKLFCNDDGIVAYALGYPTMNAIGLMLDAEAARAASRSYLHLFALAYERGFRHFTSCRYTRGYSSGKSIHAAASDAELRDWFGLTSQELPNHELCVDFVSQDGLFAVARFVPKPAR